MKTIVRTLLNLSVQKGEDIVYLHSSALCLCFVFEILFPAVPSWDLLAYLIPGKGSCQTGKDTCSASVWQCLLTDRVALTSTCLTCETCLFLSPAVSHRYVCSGQPCLVPALLLSYLCSNTCCPKYFGTHPAISSS